MIRRSLILALASFLLTGTTYATPLIQNGGFSTSNVPANDALYANGFTSTIVSAPGWNFSNGSGIIDHRWDGQAAVGTVAFLQNYSPFGWADPSISQTFNSAASNFEVSFQLAQRTGNHESVNVLLDGHALAPTLLPIDSEWTSYSFSISGLSGSSHTLSFNGINYSGASDSSLFLDNVSVTAVPEPASTALVLSALGLLGLAKRRRSPRKPA